MKNNTWAVCPPPEAPLGALGPGPAGPLDKTALLGIAFLRFSANNGVNLACCTQKLLLQHHFSETRHPHSQNDTNFNLLYLRLGYRQNFGTWPLHY